MKNLIYIRLLGEGTEVFRPVNAIKIDKLIYEIIDYDEYNPEDEVWEFPPGSHVVVVEQILEGEKVLVAVRNL